MRRVIRRDFLLFHLPLYVWMAAILFVSSLPQHKLLPVPWYLSTTVHVIEYGILGVLLVRFFLHSWSRHSTAWLLLLAFLFGVSYAAFDELYQSIVPGRQSEIGDWFADCTGLTVGIAIIRKMKR